MINPVALGDTVFFLGLLVHEPADLAGFLVLLIQIHGLSVFIFHDFRIVSCHSDDNFFVLLPISKSVRRLFDVYLFFMAEHLDVLATDYKIRFNHVRITIVIVEETE